MLYEQLHHKCITKEKQVALQALGIHTVKELLHHFPVRYEEVGRKAVVLVPKEHVRIEGVITALRIQTHPTNTTLTVCMSVRPSAGVLVHCVWYGNPKIASLYAKGMHVEIAGVVQKDFSLSNPHIKKIDALASSLFVAENHQAKLIPLYETTQGITSHCVAELIAEHLTKVSFADPIPEYIRNELHLPHIYDAFRYIHAPQELTHAEIARKRFIFEEVFFMYLAQYIERKKRSVAKTFACTIDTEKIQAFVDERFEFMPTAGQQKVIMEILADLEKDKPMARLLEGDVGSGKTAVAATAMYALLAHTHKKSDVPILQTAYIAPTEILATQQFNTLVELYNHLPIPMALITGKTCLKFPSKVDPSGVAKMSKKKMLEWVASGEIAVVVGTHAVIQKSVRFKHLALAVVDEQHRFGALQRQKLLTEHGMIPHMLAMSATPIPRTLALTLYGDMDVSLLDELPKGRKIVQTKLLLEKDIAIAYAHIRRELEAGRQAYVICPRIKSGVGSKLRSVAEECAYIQKEVFPNYTVAELHGGMSAKDTDAVLGAFRDGSIDILVSTTVVEVGVNVPNATTIVILHAERFGLAQLHQLRGRVIRGTHQPYCFAITTGAIAERLQYFETQHNGFALAEKDLELRGAGNYTGTMQSGVPDFVMEALKNKKLIAYAQKYAQEIAKNPLPKDVRDELDHRTATFEQ